MRYIKETGGEARHTITKQMTTTNPGIIKALNFAITTTGCTKNQAISLVIKTLVETGIPLRTAYDAVLGEGSYDELAGEVWEALQPA
jgi:hypothetical protein